MAQVHAQLLRNDMAKRGFAQTRRAKQQHMIERFLAFFGSADKNFQLLAHLLLADIIVQQFGAQGAL